MHAPGTRPACERVKYVCYLAITTQPTTIHRLHTNRVRRLDSATTTFMLFSFGTRAHVGNLCGARSTRAGGVVGGIGMFFGIRKKHDVDAFAPLVFLCATAG